MILAKLKLDETATLDFEMAITGTRESVSTARFVISSEEFDIACKCTLESGNAKVNIPKLVDILLPGVYNVCLEVVVDDKLFTPLKEEIEFDTLINVNTSKPKITKETQVAVSVKPKETTKLKEEVTPVEPEPTIVEEIKTVELVKEPKKIKTTFKLFDRE